MKKFLLGGKGNFYKANLHTHSTVSDGIFTPEQIKELYLEKGYSVVAFTDHNVFAAHNDLSDDKFLAITGCEMNINDDGNNYQFFKTYHLCFYAKNKDKTVSAVFNDCPIGNSSEYVTDEMRKKKFVGEYSVESINEIIRLMNDDGYLVTYNHPAWSCQRYSDYIGLKGLWGVEVFNTCGFNEGLKDTDIPYMDLLKENAGIVPVAADDTHQYLDLFGGFSVIESEKLGYDEIISAMENGNVYSSTSPLIYELLVENNILTLKCDPVRRVYLNTERRWTKFLQGEKITKAQFDLTEYFETNAKFKPKNTFIRITLEDEQGNKAWTRAYAENELR